MDEYRLSLLQSWAKAKKICEDRRSFGRIECPTGFKVIDDHTGGLLPGDIWVVGARPKVGKTSWLMEVAFSTLENTHDKRVLFLSLEMASWELSLRAYSRRMEVEYLKLLKGEIPIDPDKEKEFLKFWNRIDLEILEEGYNFRAVEIIIKELYGGNWPAYIFLDYIQLVDWKTIGDQRLSIDDYVSSIVRNAKRFGTCWVIAAQLKRPLRRADMDRAPVPDDLKGSGGLEQDAKRIVLLHKHKDKDDQITKYYMNLAVNRQGPVTDGPFEVGFDGWFYKWYELKPGEKPKPNAEQQILMDELKDNFGAEQV